MEIEKLKPITATSELEIGEAVFKAYEPGQGGYDLPDRYEHGGQYYNGDLRDYYHVGIVESVYPLRIRHMTTSGVKMDTSIGKWAYHGRLKKVDYNSAGETDKASGGGGKSMQATVVLPTGSKGSTVNLRSGMTTADGKNIIARIPVGAVVEVIQDLGHWCKIQAQGYAGYMMSNYIEYPGQGEEISGDVITSEEREKIDNALLDIENRLEIVRTILGRG